MPLKSNLRDFVNSVSNRTSRLYTWLLGEFSDINQSLSTLAQSIIQLDEDKMDKSGGNITGPVSIQELEHQRGIYSLEHGQLRILQPWRGSIDNLYQNFREGSVQIKIPKVMGGARISFEIVLNFQTGSAVIEFEGTVNTFPANNRLRSEWGSLRALILTSGGVFSNEDMGISYMTDDQDEATIHIAQKRAGGGIWETGGGAAIRNVLISDFTGENIMYYAGLAWRVGIVTQVTKNDTFREIPKTELYPETLWENIEGKPKLDFIPRLSYDNVLPDSSEIPIGFSYSYGNGVSPIGGWGHVVTAKRSSDRAWQIGFDDHEEVMAFRKADSTTGTSWGPWYELVNNRVSLKKFKKNIKSLDKSAISMINSVEVITYDRKDGALKNDISIIADDAPSEFLNKKRNAIDLHKTVFVQMKAIQELEERIKKLEEKS